MVLAGPLVLVVVLATAGALGRRRGAGSQVSETPPPETAAWHAVPGPPRAPGASDTWVLDAFSPGEIAELATIDSLVRAEVIDDRLALIMAQVPAGRRQRKVRSLSWDPARIGLADGAGRLRLQLADGTSIELDDVARSTAMWLVYCQDEFGLSLDTIELSATVWAAQLRSCGCQTPVHAPRVRVS